MQSGATERNFEFEVVRAAQDTPQVGISGEPVVELDTCRVIVEWPWPGRWQANTPYNTVQ